jgi:hypothetical protein
MVVGGPSSTCLFTPLLLCRQARPARGPAEGGGGWAWCKQWTSSCIARWLGKPSAAAPRSRDAPCGLRLHTNTPAGMVGAAPCVQHAVHPPVPARSAHPAVCPVVVGCCAYVFLVSCSLCSLGHCFPAGPALRCGRRPCVPCQRRHQQQQRRRQARRRRRRRLLLLPRLARRNHHLPVAALSTRTTSNGGWWGGRGGGGAATPPWGTFGARGGGGVPDRYCVPGLPSPSSA